jgi:hypothetical protein
MGAAEQAGLPVQSLAMPAQNCCNSPDHKISRRKLLFGTAQAAAFLAAARRTDAQVTSTSVQPRGTAKTCILITMNGAPSHVDTWDPKDGPWNPTDIDLRQYSGGVVLSNKLFPNLSQMTNDLLLLRSVASWELAHDRGQFYAQTAHPANPAFLAEGPHIGAVVSYELGKHGPLPPFLALNVDSAFQGAKFLGGFNEPLIAPVQATGLNTLQHNYYGTNSQQRFNEKYAMLRQLDAPLISSPYSDEMAAHATFYDSAKALMYDPRVASVFQFTTDESARYGDTAFGRACIVARNAVQSKLGVSFVNIVYGGWDTHVGMFDKGYTPNMYTLVNGLDRGIGNLVSDLRGSGDLSSTLIVMVGEFGRTPGLLNAQGGRDHWKDAMSAAMIGGGVKGGRAVGTTNATGDTITDLGSRSIQATGRQQQAIFIEDIAATIYSALGIDWTKTIANTPSKRIFEYVPQARSGAFTCIEEVFG